MASLRTRLDHLERGEQDTGACRRCRGRHAADLATLVLAVRDDEALCSCACCGWVAGLAAEARLSDTDRVDGHAPSGAVAARVT